VLPADDTDLETAYSSQEYLDVRTEDGVRVSQCATNEFAVHLYKNQNSNSTDAFTLTWIGLTGRAPSAANPVYLQVYNQNSSTWEIIDSDNSSPADINFTLSGAISINIPDYYIVGNWISARVYQEMS